MIYTTYKGDNTMIDTKNIKLEYHDIESAGKMIKAYISQPFNCIEFTMKGEAMQPILMTLKEPATVAFEPWIQFEPKEWSDLLEQILSNLVYLWNQNHGENVDNTIPKHSVSNALRKLADGINYQLYNKEQVKKELEEINEKLNDWK